MTCGRLTIHRVESTQQDPEGQGLTLLWLLDPEALRAWHAGLLQSVDRTFGDIPQHPCRLWNGDDYVGTHELTPKIRNVDVPAIHFATAAHLELSVAGAQRLREAVSMLLGKAAVVMSFPTTSLLRWPKKTTEAPRQPNRWCIRQARRNEPSPVQVVPSGWVLLEKLP